MFFPESLCVNIYSSNNIDCSSKVPAFLNVVDIAGLVKGAHEGKGLGNAFLSNINACDAIFHVVSKFRYSLCSPYLPGESTADLQLLEQSGTMEISSSQQ